MWRFGWNQRDSARGNVPRSVAFAFSVSVTIFGGFAPFVATWLIAQTGDPLSPAYYLMATALLSIMALMAIERRAPRAES